MIALRQRSRFKNRILYPAKCLRLRLNTKRFTLQTQSNSIALVVAGRADFRVVDDNLQLIDIAPGIHIERHTYSHTAFRPSIATDLRLMDTRLFRLEPMNMTTTARRIGKMGLYLAFAAWEVIGDG